jgi:predicted HTH transcriptional regulator
LVFSFFFYRHKNQINIDEKNGSIEKGASVQTNDQINVQINVQLNAMEMQVLSLVSQNPNLTLDEVATHISKSSKTAQRHLDALRKKNVIRRVGSRKDGRWEIVGDTDVTDE